MKKKSDEQRNSQKRNSIMTRFQNNAIRDNKIRKCVLIIGALSFLFLISANLFSQPAFKWRYKTGEQIDSSPAIGKDGTIYIGSWDHCLYAINSNGSLRWKYETGGIIQSSPAIGRDGIIYFGSSDDYLYSINANGSLRWRYKIRASSSPTIGSDNIIYVGSGDHNLYAINHNGSLRWRYKTGGKIWSSAAIGRAGTIYVGSVDNHFYAINSDGSLRWRYKTGGIIRSSPAIGSDGTIYVGSDDYHIYAFNPDGSLEWKYKTGWEIWSSAAVGRDGTIYVGSRDGHVYAINPDGSLRWRYKTSEEIFSSPALERDGILYVGSSDGSNGFLYAINLDGSLRWRHKIIGSVLDSSPAIGRDGTIYVCSGGGFIYAFEGSSGLTDSPWPKFHQGLTNSGNASDFIEKNAYVEACFPLNIVPGKRNLITVSCINTNDSLSQSKFRVICAKKPFNWKVEVPSDVDEQKIITKNSKAPFVFLVTPDSLSSSGKLGWQLEVLRKRYNKEVWEPCDYFDSEVKVFKNQNKKHILIDTDPAMGKYTVNDIDDGLALLYAFQQNAEIAGIAVTWGNLSIRSTANLPDNKMIQSSSDLEIAYQNALTIKDYFGGTFPVKKGSNVKFDPKSYPRDEASEFLANTVSSMPGEYTLIALGNLTNIANAMKIDPNFAENVREIYIVAGCIDKFLPYPFNQEWNIKFDPQAAEYVLKNARRAFLVPFDATMDWAFTEAEYKEVMYNLNCTTLFLKKPIRDWLDSWISHTVSTFLGMGIIKSAFFPYDSVGMAIALNDNLITKERHFPVSIFENITVKMTDFPYDGRPACNIIYDYNISGQGGFKGRFLTSLTNPKPCEGKVNLKKINSGLLLGLGFKKSTNHSPWNDFYKTLWIAQEGDELKVISKVDGILFPRRDGFWHLDVKTAIKAGEKGPRISDDYIEILKLGIPAAKVICGLDTNSYDYLSSNTEYCIDSINLLFVDNDHLCYEGYEQRSGGAHPLHWPYLGVLTVDSCRRIKIQEIFGPEGRSALFRYGREFYLRAQNREELSDRVREDEDWGVLREKGKWNLKGILLFSCEAYRGTYALFGLPLVPTKSLVSYDELSPSWEVIKAHVPEAIDTVSSPAKDFCVVIKDDQVLIFVDFNESSIGNMVAETKFDEKVTVVMSQWALGTYVDKWNSEIKKNSRK